VVCVICRIIIDIEAIDATATTFADLPPLVLGGRKDARSFVGCCKDVFCEWRDNASLQARWLEERDGLCGVLRAMNMKDEERCLQVMERLMSNHEHERHAIVKRSHPNEMFAEWSSPSPRRVGDGWTILDLQSQSDCALVQASKRGLLRVVDMLLSKHFADVHAFDDRDRIWIIFFPFGDEDHCVRDDAALRYAAKNGHVAVVDLLLKKYKADVHACNGATLRWAAQNGHIAVVDLLLKKYDADVHASHGDALRCAAGYGHVAVVDLLLSEYGADARACDIKTVKRWGGSNSHQVAKLLKKHGARERRFGCVIS